ncbi:MAG: hypothetical protein AB1725_11495 [Armatimonadota bacterium]
MNTKLKMSTLLILLACALAATTSLTPILARAKAAVPEREQDDRSCRNLLSLVAQRITSYRAEHNGLFPYSLNEIGGPFRCPVHKTRYWYRIGVELPDWLEYRPESRDAFRAAVCGLSWDEVPIVSCPAHFDPSNIINVMYYDQGEGLPPRPMGVPAEGEDIRILGATLDGGVSYFVPDNPNAAATAEFARTLLRSRGQE